MALYTDSENLDLRMHQRHGITIYKNNSRYILVIVASITLYFSCKFLTAKVHLLTFRERERERERQTEREREREITIYIT